MVVVEELKPPPIIPGCYCIGIGICIPMFMFIIGGGGMPIIMAGGCYIIGIGMGGGCIIAGGCCMTMLGCMGIGGGIIGVPIVMGGIDIYCYYGIWMGGGYTG